MIFGLLIELLGIPPNAAEHGYVIDSMLEVLHWFMLILFVGWGTFYAYTLWAFRQKVHPKANYTGVKSHLPSKLEGGILVLEIILLMSFAAPIWAERVSDFPTGPEVIHIRVMGQQYAWNYQYAGSDGKFGDNHSDQMTGSNPMGVDRKNDPEAADDLTTINEMHIPVNHPVILEITSRDVIHNFCIPTMRSAQDAIPGSRIPMWFKPVKVGAYEVVCAQLCGANHYAMKGTVVVDSEEDYKKWFNETAQVTGVKVVDGIPVIPNQAPAPVMAQK